LCDAVAALSMPPGTNWDIGTRFGKPPSVKLKSRSCPRASAARHPSSAAVRHVTDSPGVALSAGADVVSRTGGGVFDAAAGAGVREGSGETGGTGGTGGTGEPPGGDDHGAPVGMADGPEGAAGP
jgi:hypothetical protein